MTKTPLLIYLHGLNSSSQSTKAQDTIRYIHANKLDMDIWVPELPNHANDVRKLFAQRINKEYGLRPIYIIGSSLGGYLGTWLMQRLLYLYPDIITRLVVINPAVRPYELFEDYLCPQKNFYTNEEWLLTYDHVEALKTLETPFLDQPGNILLLAQKEDETLDYRRAVAKYDGCPAIIQDGGNHAFEGYTDMLPTVFDFLSGKPIL